MRFVWDERKRKSNLRDHGFDFCDAPDGLRWLTYTIEDGRFIYGEQRFMTLGFMGGVAVSIVHTETPRVIRVISFRKATRYEEAMLFQSLKD